MKVFYSIYHQIKLLQQYGIKHADHHTGWGKLIDITSDILTKYGLEMVDNIEDADIELFLGQPSLKYKPSMKPNIVLTMYESDTLPDIWVESLNTWQTIINPSTWGYNTFKNSGVISPIHIIPLWVDNRFEFKERDIDAQWTYLTMAVQLTDRKNAKMVIDLFMEECGKSLPDDITLIAKTLPTTHNPLQWSCWLHENVFFLQQDLSQKDLLSLMHQSHVSVNPSSGEGFGWIPGESMRSGCCTILSNFSALKDMCNSLYNLPLSCLPVPSWFGGLKGNIGLPDIDELKRLILWTYEHKEESIKMGKMSSNWLKDTYTDKKFCDSLINIMKDLIDNTSKADLKVDDSKNYIVEDLSADVDLNTGKKV